MKVKTYGVYELTEWHGKVKAGSLEVRVSFTGGTSSPSGAQPAYFVTKDPITQFVIENSKEFKSGFITLTMSQDVPGTHPRMAVPKLVPSPVPSNVPSSEADLSDTSDISDPSDNSDPSDPSETAGLTQMEFACNDDARDYLMEHFGFVRSKLHTQAEMIEAGKSKGVEIHFV